MATPLKKAVLVVDDEPIIRLDLATALAADGFEVLESADAASALALFRERTDVSAAVVDIHLANGANGYELVRAMRAERPYCVIVIMSGAHFSLPPDFDEHVTIESKPCDARKIAFVIEARLDRLAAERS